MPHDRRTGKRPLGQTTVFWRSVSPLAQFGEVGDPACFTPLPDDWTVGLADVTGSTAAIAAGRYKAVNTVGAAVISAVSNAIGSLDFPYLFAGDGAAVVVAPAEAPAAAEALAATSAWALREFGLTLRTGTVTVAALRQAGQDVQAARFGASADATYAMFSGGGLGWAEAALKAGLLPAPVAAAGAQPDLSGLSCRFHNLPARRGVILSVLMRPCGAADDPRFAVLLGKVLGHLADGPDAGRPISVEGLAGGFAASTITLNARIGHRPGRSRLLGWVSTATRAVMVAGLLACRGRLGTFSARRYLDQVVANTDFRKYGDGLMMTVDCGPAVAAQIEQLLAEAERDGVATFGLHAQEAATVTCVVPSALAANHVHFVDGAAGGYAVAASRLKSRLASPPAV